MQVGYYKTVEKQSDYKKNFNVFISTKLTINSAKNTICRI